ncbi:MAG TPA: helix-turn-helix transcriptional regulator, partial [Polyangiaceae bacterium]
VKSKKTPGRMREYRRGVPLPVPDDFGIPTCAGCGEEYLSVEQAEALDALQAPAYAKWQTEHLTKVIRQIQAAHGVTQRDIEGACGVTGTYLSHVLSGRKEASATLVSLLEAYSLYPLEFQRRREGGSWDAARQVEGAALTAKPGVPAYEAPYIPGGLPANENLAA